MYNFIYCFYSKNRKKESVKEISSQKILNALLSIIILRAYMWLCDLLDKLGLETNCNSERFIRAC